MKPGVYTIPAGKYHADPCPAPSLNSTVAGIMWHRSPAHAMLAHPRLNPHYQPDTNAAFDLGTAAHALLLEGSKDCLVVIDAPDWRTKAAKEARDAARAEGRTALLGYQMAKVVAIVDAARAAIKESEISGVWQDGAPEQSLFAQWNDTWLRGRVDWMSTDRRFLLDYKTVGGSAHPDAFIRGSMTKLGYDIQAGLYCTINSLCGGPPVEDQRFIWIVQETAPPYAVSFVGAGPRVMDMATRKTDLLIQQWAECLESGHWPGYGRPIHWAEPMPWDEAEIMEREEETMEEENDG